MTYKKDRTNYVVNNNKLNYNIPLKIFKHNLKVNYLILKKCLTNLKRES